MTDESPPTPSRGTHQGLGGAALIAVGMLLKGGSAGVFYFLGAAWLLPGVALAASGVGVVTGARWGRRLSVAAVILGAVTLSIVALRRTTIPPAMADAIEFASEHPDAKGGLGDTLARVRKERDVDPVVFLRDPDQASLQGWFYTGYCGCPGIPWYAVLLFACVPAWGRRIEAR